MEPKRNTLSRLSNFCSNLKRMKLIAGGVAAVALIGIATVIVVYTTRESNDEGLPPLSNVVQGILDRMPIIDGHNDFPYNVRGIVFNDLSKFDFNANLSTVEPWASSPYSHTDIPRLRAGRVGAQFWVAYTTCASQYKDSVEQTIEQIDVIRRLTQVYSDDLQLATSADEIEDAIEKGKIASLIAVEGGHSIQSSFAVLRVMYDLGVRYMTLTHNCNTPWADSSKVDAPNATIIAQNDGLSDFGLKVVAEMNRLGMMVDISHVSNRTMKDALLHSVAPVIFSHSSAWALCNHHRNVPDDVLHLVEQTDSLVMVNFYPGFIRCDDTVATLQHVVEHIEYIRNITGPDHVGLGGDFDGIEKTSVGLEDVSKYPDLIQALWDTGRWTEEDLEKLAGRNLLRVFRAVEKVRDELAQTGRVHEEILSRKEFEEKDANLDCITAKLPGDPELVEE